MKKKVLKKDFPAFSVPGQYLLRDKVVFGIDGDAVQPDFIMQGDAGFRTGFPDDGDGLAAADAAARLHQGLTQMGVERADARLVVQLDGKAETAVCTDVVNDAAAGGDDRVANLRHVVDAPMGKFLFGERVVNHLETILYCAPILEGVDDGQVCCQCGIAFQFCEQVPEGFLHFGKALAGTLKFAVGVFFQSESETAEVQGAVPQDPVFFGLQDGFVHGSADALDFIPDDLVLAIDGQHVPVGDIVYNFRWRKNEKANDGKNHAQYGNDGSCKGNLEVLAAGSLVRKYVDFNLSHERP